jgi:hypothetical protein
VMSVRQRPDAIADRTQRTSVIRGG